MSDFSLTNCTVAVLGAGRSGRAAQALAEARGGKVTLYDSREQEGAICLSLEEARKTRHDLVVISPGIAVESEFAQAFVAGAGELIGEIELAARCFDGGVIGITGTNGKTTTTELVAELMRGAGLTCEPCGNYGVPFSEIALWAEPPETVALELSSFQLETIDTFRPEVALWLNFSPDHMDRYQSVEDYRRAKEMIFRNLTSGLVAVVREGEKVATRDAQVRYFAESDCPVPIRETPLRGRHNAENLAAAWLGVTAFFEVEGAINPLKAADVPRILENYQPPAHRCQFVAEVAGVEYINDSKATNLHALQAALKSFDEPIVLLFGGKEKGLDYAPLAPVLEAKARLAIAFGEIGPALAAQFGAHLPVTVVDGLAEAVQLAADQSEKGELVLLSPGTSSFDQFPNYEARGAAFCEAVNCLTPSLS